MFTRITAVVYFYNVCREENCWCIRWDDKWPALKISCTRQVTVINCYLAPVTCKSLSDWLTKSNMWQFGIYSTLGTTTSIWNLKTVKAIIVFSQIVSQAKNYKETQCLSNARWCLWPVNYINSVRNDVIAAMNLLLIYIFLENKKIMLSLTKRCIMY